MKCFVFTPSLAPAGRRPPSRSSRRTAEDTSGLVIRDKEKGVSNTGQMCRLAQPLGCPWWTMAML